MSRIWSPPPQLRPDVVGALPFLNQAILGQRDAALNVEGGDVGGHGSPTLVARHVGNYQMAVELAGDLDLPDGPYVDVGCGVGALAAWTASKIDRRLVLCDQDAAVVRFGGRTFGVDAVTELEEAPHGALVTGMEVIEHVPPEAQDGFLRTLWEHVLPGGVLMLSTPDEAHYPGGWSGYAPHVGVLTGAGLLDALETATDGSAEVYRIVDGAFDVSMPRRWLERVGNGAWNVIQRAAPVLSGRLAERSGRAEPLDVDDLETAATPVRVIDVASGVGGGLIAVARKPE